MIDSLTLFRSDIFIEANVGTLEQRTSIISEIKEKQNQNPQGMLNSNDNCYRIKAPCTDIDWLFKKINNLLDTAIKFYSSQDLIFRELNITPHSVFNYWANVNTPGSRNKFHSHKSELFSVVYYLQATGTGELRFTNPANILGDCNRLAPFTRDFTFNPKDGDLILWPSWVPHEVETNFSNKERINLAFDINHIQ